MPNSCMNVKLFDVILCVSRGLDLLSPDISDHHLRVAYVALRLADEMGLSMQDCRDAVIAGALHDVGAASTDLRLSLQDYSLSRFRQQGVLEDVHLHGIEGYLLLRGFPLFARAADVIRYHHVQWLHGRGAEFQGLPVPLLSHVLQLADRVAVLPTSGRNILEQSADIREKIVAGTGELYRPDVAEAFASLSRSEAFWLDVISLRKEDILRGRLAAQNVVLSLDELYELARLFSRIIDFRSPYTALHSSMVASTAERLAELLGIAGRERKIIGIAGFLHDVGKLAVPPEILDKPGKLTVQEMLIMKQHPYYTQQILSTVAGLEEVCTYASLHHERLDGTGYPFRAPEVPLGARIIAVADIFTAISEHRPYRPGMTRLEALTLLDRQVQSGAIDGDIVRLIPRHYEELVPTVEYA